MFPYTCSPCHVSLSSTLSSHIIITHHRHHLNLAEYTHISASPPRSVPAFKIGPICTTNLNLSLNSPTSPFQSAPKRLSVINSPLPTALPPHRPTAIPSTPLPQPRPRPHPSQPNPSSSPAPIVLLRLSFTVSQPQYILTAVLPARRPVLSIFLATLLKAPTSTLPRTPLPTHPLLATSFSHVVRTNLITITSSSTSTLVNFTLTIQYIAPLLGLLLGPAPSHAAQTPRG